jgi:signal transduction histidine kinase
MGPGRLEEPHGVESGKGAAFQDDVDAGLDRDEEGADALGAGHTERTWRQLDEVLAVISHDLRGPLSALNVAIDALGDPGIDPAMRARYLHAMRRAISRAERFLGDLLDVGRMEAGTFQVDCGPVSVAPVLEEAAREHEEPARGAGNWVVLEIADDVGLMWVDRDRILQALDALICNALRYARGTGAITLRAEMRRRVDGERVRLWVCDQGPGLPRGQVEQVFDRPWRSRGERRSGAGLGLYIARGIAEAHGGSVSAMSRPGEGARFCIEVPAA